MGTRWSWSRGTERASAALALALVALAAGCTGGPSPGGSATPSTAPGRVAAGPSWTPVALPATGTGRPVNGRFMLLEWQVKSRSPLV